MDALDYAEKTASETLARAQAAYDALHTRIYAFATVLATGAGGAGVYALGRLDEPSQLVPLGTLSCWWFLIVGAVLLKGAASRAITLGTSGDAIRRRLLQHQQSPQTAGDVAAALWFTRWDQLASVDQQTAAFAAGTTERARVLDRAYWCVVASPLVAGLGWLLAGRA